MRKVLLALGLFISLISSAQVAVQNSGSKIRYVNGIYVGTKQDAQFSAADSGAIYAKNDSTLMFKYKGTARALMFAANVSSIIHDSLYAVYQLKAGTSSGVRFVSNGGTVAAEWGVGGGSNFDFHGFAGYNANRSVSYTDRSFTDKKYVDSIAALKQPQLNGTGFVKASGTTISYDNSTYLTGINASLVNAVGTISNNTTGNAATATLAANSTLWNSQTLDLANLASLNIQPLVYDVTNAQVRPATQFNLRTFLDLGTYAYRSSGLAELSGATFTGTVTTNGEYRVNPSSGDAIVRMYTASTEQAAVRANATKFFIEVGTFGERLSINSSSGLLTYTGAANYSSTITATSGFIKSGYDDTYFLLAGGGTTSTSNYATAAALSGYLPLSAGASYPLSGTLYAPQTSLNPATNTSSVYSILNTGSGFAGKYIVQAGGGSSGFGGAVNMFGHSHATKAGWVTVGLSSSSGGKFTVNNQGLADGTDVFSVDYTGALTGTTVNLSSTLAVSGITTLYNDLNISGSGKRLNVGNYTWVGGSGGGDYGSVGYNVGYTTTTGTYTYAVSDMASFLKFQLGGFEFWTAASGTAGASMTPSKRMVLTNAGNLTIGSTDGSGSGNLFTNDITTNGIIYAYKSASDVVLEGGQIYMSGGYTSFRRAVDNSFNIDNYNGGSRVTALKIAQSGAATFYSTVTTGLGGVIISSTNTKVESDGSSIYLKAAGNTYLNTAASAYVDNGGMLYASATQIPNGGYYKAIRTTGSAAINLLGIEAATDNTVMVASNMFKLRNTGTGDGANLFTVNTSGNGVFTGSVAATAANFSGTLTLSAPTPILQFSNGTSAGLIYQSGTTLRLSDNSGGKPIVYDFNDGSMSVNADKSGYAVQISNSNTNGSGVLIQAGNTSSNYPLNVVDKTNTYNYFLVKGNGELLASSLVGTGDRMVVANSSGVLSTQAIPSGGGIDGTYSPTLTGVTNITSISAATGIYTKVDSTWHISIPISVTPSAVGTCQFTISIPSSMSIYQRGYGVVIGGSGEIGIIEYSTSTSVLCRFTSVFSGVPTTLRVVFDYSEN